MPRSGVSGLGEEWLPWAAHTPQPAIIPPVLTHSHCLPTQPCVLHSLPNLSFPHCPSFTGSCRPGTEQGKDDGEQRQGQL